MLIETTKSDIIQWYNWATREFESAIKESNKDLPTKTRNQTYKPPNPLKKILKMCHCTTRY